MRARLLAVKLVLAGLGALLSLYLWLRAIDGGPNVPRSPVDLPAVERGAVPAAVPPRPHLALDGLRRLVRLNRLDRRGLGRACGSAARFLAGRLAADALGPEAADDSE